MYEDITLGKGQNLETLRWAKDEPEDTYLVQPANRNCDILVSLQHKNPQKIAQTALPVLNNLPPLLLTPIETLIAPFDDFKDIAKELNTSYKPGAKIAGLADRASGMVIIAGTEHDAENYDLFRTHIISHEAAHLLDEEGGCPEEFIQEFNKACYMDKEYHKGLTFFPDCFDDFKPVYDHQLVTRHWSKNDLSINTYAATHEKENWTESVSLYVNALQDKNFYQNFSAIDFWPYRFEFFQMFFSTEFI